MNWIDSLWQSAKTHDVLLWWLFAASLVMLMLSPVVVGWLVVRLPSDYFADQQREPPASWQRHPVLRPVVLVVKNLLGISLLLAGLAMLVMPGQGLFTIVVCVLLVDFPGKYRFERWLVTREPVWLSINWLRKRSGRAPLDRPE